jgi:hypothetical protein
MTPLHISTNFRSDIVVICGPIVSRVPKIRIGVPNNGVVAVPRDAYLINNIGMMPRSSGPCLPWSGAWSPVSKPPGANESRALHLWERELGRSHPRMDEV